VRAAYAILAAGAALAEQADTLVTIASAASNGPLLASLDPGTAGELAADYAFNRPAFFALAASLVNQAVIAAETAQPEGARMELVLPGMPDVQALANGVNTAWLQGQITDQGGSAIPAWPGADSIAFVDQNGDLVLQWVKGQPWVWILVAVLVVVSVVAIWDALHNTPFSLATFASSAVQAGSWLLKNWPWVAGGVVVVAITPPIVGAIARTREATNELAFARRGGF
jgi:hypothetical protein